MKSAFATSWKNSVQRRKQRKYTYNAPAHVKGKFLAAHLSKALKEKYGTRSVRIRTGDKVRILRGNSKGKEGKIERVDVERTQVYIAGVDAAKMDGSKAPVTLHPSSVMIIELDLSDKKRKEKLAGKTELNNKVVGSDKSRAPKVEAKATEAAKGEQ
jgi:large subunit ribosomal protein L24